MVICKSWVLGLRRRRICLDLIRHKSKPSLLMIMVGGGEKLGRLDGEREREREVATLRYNLTVPSCIFFFNSRMLGWFCVFGNAFCILMGFAFPNRNAFTCVEINSIQLMIIGFRLIGYIYIFYTLLKIEFLLIIK